MHSSSRGSVGITAQWAERNWRSALVDDKIKASSPPPARRRGPTRRVGLPNSIPQQPKGETVWEPCIHGSDRRTSGSSTTSTVDRYEKAPEPRTKRSHGECFVHAK